jgi:hypothetical protein
MAFDPHILEAQLALNRISSFDLPRLAWDAMEAGFDRSAIRRLATLDAPLFSKSKRSYRGAINEMHQAKLEKGEALFDWQEYEPKKFWPRTLILLRDFESLWWENDYCGSCRT